MDISIIKADYLDPAQAKDIEYLLSCYASDIMGGGTPLNEKILKNVPLELSKRPYAFSVIAYVEGKAAGLINCFEAFSTFRCKPLINIHDVIVINEYRRIGLAQSLLSKVEEIAKEKGCCKLTLEVLEGNQVAQQAYRKHGFTGYELDPKMGKALFWEKPL